MIRAESALAHTLESVLENMTEGYAAFDRELRYIYLNSKAAELAGWTRERMLGKTLYELYPGETFHPAFQRFEQVLKTGKKEQMEYFSGVAGKWIQLRIMPAEEGLIIFVTDISEKKKFEENAQYLQTLTHAIHDALISTDSQYRIVSWNAGAEKMYGWKAEEMIGMNAAEIAVSTLSEEKRKEWKEALIQKGWWHGEVIQRTRDGRELLVMARLSALRNSKGEMCGAVALNRDITEERKAEEAQMQLAAIVRSSEDAIVSKGLDGIIRSWNKAAEQIFGYSQQEAVGKHITLIIPEELHYEEVEIIRKIKSGIPIRHYETERVTKDGRRISISLSISPVRNSQGIITGASKIARDISERRRADAALRESEERLRAMFNQAGVGVCLLNADGTIMQMNPRFGQITGYSEQELTGTSCMEITHAEDKPASRKILDELMNTAKETVTFEKRYLRKNHEHIWARITITKIRDEHKQVQQYVAIIEDISEHKRAEAGLRESENRFRILAENIQSMAWMASPDGWIFWCNQRWYEYLGRSFETIKGWGWESTLHPDHFSKVHEFLATAWQKGEPWELTFPLKGKDGNYRWFLTSAFPVRDGSGQLLRWIGTCTDVNALKTSG